MVVLEEDSPIFRTSSWVNFALPNPAARLVIQEIAATRRLYWLATMASGTVLIPTASAPSFLKARISAGVS